MLLQTFTTSIQDITGQDLRTDMQKTGVDPDVEDEVDRLRLRVEELNIEVRRLYMSIFW